MIARTTISLPTTPIRRPHRLHLPRHRSGAERKILEREGTTGTSTAPRTAAVAETTTTATARRLLLLLERETTSAGQALAPLLPTATAGPTPLHGGRRLSHRSSGRGGMTVGTMAGVEALEVVMVTVVEGQ